MAKTDNLSDFLTDVANSIRTKTGTTEQINAQDFSDKILSIQSESTLKKLLDTTKSADYLFSNYSGTFASVENVIQPSDTENVTSMRYTFSNCRELQHIPQLNTSNVTDMTGMFKGFTSLHFTPSLDTSKVTSMREMFSGCTQLGIGAGSGGIPLFDTSNVTDMESMFEHCSSLWTNDVPQFDTSKVTNMYNMFKNCTGLESIPQFDTSNVTLMAGMFEGCTGLTTVPALNADKVTNMMSMFEGCTNLKSILMTNIGTDLTIAYSTKFEREDLLVILNNLKTVTSTKVLTMGATNLAKLTEEDKAIATNKGWTLA